MHAPVTDYCCSLLADSDFRYSVCVPQAFTPLMLSRTSFFSAARAYMWIAGAATSFPSNMRTRSVIQEIGAEISPGLKTHRKGEYIGWHRRHVATMREESRT